MQTDHADGRVQLLLEEGVGLLTLNDQERRNALDAAMLRGLAEALQQLAAEPALRVLVVSGGGNKTFSAGEELDPDLDAAAIAEYEALAAQACDRLAAFPRPVIAGIRGVCLGGGLGLALAADLRIAGTGAEFGLPAVQLGLAPGRGLVRRLVALVGPERAKSLLLSGASIDAAEAQRIGLVGVVLPDEGVADAVLELARSLADLPPLALQAAKAMVDGAGQGRADELAQACRGSADHREAQVARAEGGEARFKGK